MKPEFITIVEDAAKAPSGHNTQPWIFEIKESQIIIRPNFKRKLEVVDPDNHALYISLGCTLENLILSAKDHGYSTMVNKNFTNGQEQMDIDLIPSKEVERDDLYDFLKLRQCTRKAYNDTPVEKSVLEELGKEAKNDNVDILFFYRKP